MLKVKKNPQNSLTKAGKSEKLLIPVSAGAPGRPGEGRGGGRPSPCSGRTMPGPCLERARAGPLPWGRGVSGRLPRAWSELAGRGRPAGEGKAGGDRLVGRAGGGGNLLRGRVWPQPWDVARTGARPFGEGESRRPALSPAPAPGGQGELGERGCCQLSLDRIAGKKVCLGMFWQSQTLFVLFSPHRRGQHGVYKTKQCSKMCKTL